MNSIADPHEQAERKWQKYLRRLQAGAYGDVIALTGIADMLSVSIGVVKKKTVSTVDPTIASSRIVLALVGQYHYVSLEPQEDDKPGSTDIEILPALPSHSFKYASSLQEAAVEWREDCVGGREDLVVRREVALSQREANCSEFELRLGLALSGPRAGCRVEGRQGGE